MKRKFLGLAILLLAGAAQGALAQDQGGGQGGGGQGGGRGGGGHGGGPGPAAQPQAHRGMPYAPGAWGPAAQARPPGVPPQAHTPPAAAPGPQPHPQWRGGDLRPPGWSPPQRALPPSGWNRSPGSPPETIRPGRSGEAFHERRGEGRPDGGHDGFRHEGERRDGGRWDQGHGDWGHDGWGRGDWERGRHDGPRWAPHAYPPFYRSPHRYHGGSWRPPEGYYYRAWRFGELLPWAWYQPDYWIGEWWRYDLPEPPPGYDWVRVGSDALLVDEFTGRIVQVVRFVFW